MPVFPLGLAFVAASLLKEDHDVKALDLLGEEEPATALAEAIRDFTPDLIGLSVRNIDNQNPLDQEFFLPDIRATVEACRRTSSAPIVVGGAGYSIFPQETLEFLKADYGIIGDGEQALCRVAQTLKAGKAVSGIPGVIARGSRNSSPPAVIPDLRDIPAPAHGLLDVKRYSNTGPIPIQGKRGCDRKCIYCTSPLIAGRTVRARSPKDIAGEIEDMLDHYGVNRFFFVDNLFNWPEAHAMALCEAISARGLHIQWRCIVNPVPVKRGLVERMKKAGCTEISFGFESGSNAMLKRLGKGFSVEDIQRSSRLFKEFEINRTGFLLLGGPGESRETVKESLSFAERLQMETLKAGAGIRIYPGTPLATLARMEKAVSQDSRLLEPVFYFSRETEKKWLTEVVRKEVERHPGWML